MIYVRKEGVIRGPFNDTLLSQKIESKEIDAQVEISEDKLSWTPITDDKRFASLFIAKGSSESKNLASENNTVETIKTPLPIENISKQVKSTQPPLPEILTSSQESITEENAPLTAGGIVENVAELLWSPLSAIRTIFAPQNFAIIPNTIGVMLPIAMILGIIFIQLSVIQNHPYLIDNSSLASLSIPLFIIPIIAWGCAWIAFYLIYLIFTQEKNPNELSLVTFASTSIIWIFAWILFIHGAFAGVANLIEINELGYRFGTMIINVYGFVMVLCTFIAVTHHYAKIKESQIPVAIFLGFTLWFCATTLLILFLQNIV